MDLGMGPVRLLAGPVARLLNAEGTPEERRAEVIEHASLSGEHVEELGLRHVTRLSAWLLLFGLVFAASTLILIPVQVLAVESVSNLVFDVTEWPVFFPFFMAMVHLIKVAVVHYLPERMWDPGSRVGRVTMLAQGPEILLAALMTTGSVLL